MLIWVGTYSQRGSKGIYAVQVAPDSGAMTIVGASPAENASFLCFGSQERHLFAVNEGGGGAVSFAISGTSLTPTSGVNIKGSGPCFLATDPSGRWLITANYNDGTYTVVPVAANGALGDPTDFQKDPGTPGPGQNSGHAHCSVFSPDGRFVYVNDLGMDRVCIYAFNASQGNLKLSSATDLAPGTGPRHFAFHPSLPVAYAIDELNSTVTVFERDRASGALRVQQTVPTLPDAIEAQRQAKTFRNACAELQISADGKYLYGSNRGHDTIAVYSIQSPTGKLAPLGHVGTGGKEPRSFALVPHTDLLITANQNTDTIVSFRIGRNGMPVPTGASLAIPAPVCVLPSTVRQ